MSKRANKFFNERPFVKLVCHEMMGTTQHFIYFQFIEWSLFIGLCGLSAFFMHGVLDNYFSRKTSFAQSEESVTELPTITFCFPESNSPNIEYRYGIDFVIEYKLFYRNANTDSIFLREGSFTKTNVPMGMSKFNFWCHFFVNFRKLK